MIEYENSELTFSHEHTKITTIYRATINENNLKKRFSATKVLKKKPQPDGYNGWRCNIVKTYSSR